MTNANFPILGPIIIGTRNIDKAKEFYLAVFGLVIDSESANYVGAHAVDGTRIEIEEDSENRFPNWAAQNIGTHKCAEFHVVNIKAFLERVAAFGGRVINPPTARPWGDVNAEFSDCDGNIFLVSQKSE